MSIPGYQTIMLPLLGQLADRREHYFKDVVKALGKEFGLSTVDLKMRFPCGKAFIFASRVGQANSYLKKVGLINAPRRGVLRISARGRKLLGSWPKKLDDKLLVLISDFSLLQNLQKSKGQAFNKTTIASAGQQASEKTIDAAYENINRALRQALIDKVRCISPIDFERLMVRLLVTMGYGSIENVRQAYGKPGDEGIDGIIKLDKLGLDTIYVQAKRRRQGNTVGRPEIQKFVGALAGKGAKKGVFITTSSFTKEARDYFSRNEITLVLVDGNELAQLMIEHNLGVSVKQSYHIKRLDNGRF